MKLFFDARYIRTDYHDGISRYSAELGKALAELASVTFLICDEAQVAFLPKGADFITIHKPTSAKEPFTPFVLNRYGPDVVFSPMQTMGSFGRNYKLILTLHDLIYYRHRTPPRNLNWLIRIGWRIYHATYLPQRLALNGADVIATVSETSKKDILDARLTKRPVIVTTNAPQQLRDYLDKDILATEAPTNLIYMGSFMEYKNVETLIKGLEFLPGYTLHLLSRIRPERRAQFEKMTPKGANIVFHNGVSDEAYAKLLADHALLVSASLDEGYGIPVADAMALGVPAVITDMPIFHEVARNGALYFNPTDASDFADKVKKASQLKTYQDLSAKGLVQSQTFSWTTSANILLETAKKLSKK